MADPSRSGVENSGRLTQGGLALAGRGGGKHGRCKFARSRSPVDGEKNRPTRGVRNFPPAARRWKGDARGANASNCSFDAATLSTRCRSQTGRWTSTSKGPLDAWTFPGKIGSKICSYCCRLRRDAERGVRRTTFLPYPPETGRFIRRDSVLAGKLSNPSQRRRSRRLHSSDECRILIRCILPREVPPNRRRRACSWGAVMGEMRR